MSHRRSLLLAVLAVLLAAPGASALSPPHDASNGIACVDCHAPHGGMMGMGFGLVPYGAAQEKLCKTCHNPTGSAAGMALVGNHVVYGGAVVVDCGSCHDPHGPFTTVDPHPGGGTALNLSLIRSNTKKYVPAAKEPALFQARPDHFAFAEANPPFTGICQTCHTQTAHHRNDASSDHSHGIGEDCTDCHTHDSGFQSCKGCHGFPPVEESGKDGLVSVPAPTGATSPGAHARHATEAGYNYACTTCHHAGMPVTPVSDNNKIQMGFDVPGHSGEGTHYDGQLLDPPYNYQGTYGTTVTLGGSLTCSGLYCHSDGTSVSTGQVEGSVSPPWDAQGPIGCGACHGAPPTYVRNDKANGHNAHKYFATCDVCHFATTQDGATITDTAVHADGTFDVVPNPDVATFDYTYDIGGGRCDNVTCHGGIGTLNHHQGLWVRWGGHDIQVGTAVYDTDGCYEVSIVPTAKCYPACYYPMTFTYDFGDGTTAVGDVVTHAYPGPGPYPLKVTARDKYNHPSWPIHQKLISPKSTNLTHTADRTVDVQGFTVTITDLSTDPDFDQCANSGPGKVTIHWGDGTTTLELLDLTDQPSGQVFTHTYYSAGSRTIIYAVDDNGGAPTQFKNATVMVPTYEPLVISGHISPKPGGSSPFVWLERESGVSIKYTVIDATGAFNFGDVSSYGEDCLVVAPKKTGYTFVPAKRTVCTSDSNVDFTW